jgi:hypothetical protein
MVVTLFEKSLLLQLMVCNFGTHNTNLISIIISDMLGKSKVQGYKTRGNLYFTLFSFFGLKLSYLIFCHLGYVCSIKEKLFSMTKEERKKIKDTYKDKVPNP